jgi:hypothetical protein
MRLGLPSTVKLQYYELYYNVRITEIYHESVYCMMCCLYYRWSLSQKVAEGLVTNYFDCV